MMSSRKTGPPMTAVTIPIGRSKLTTRCATMSANSMRAAPMRADAGTRCLLSEPMSSLAMCGATRPTNPIIPVKLTIPAARSDTIISVAMRTLLTSTPRLLA